MRAEHWYDFGTQAGDSDLFARIIAHIATATLPDAVADAVGRHAVKDPGVRGILKRAIAVCHLRVRIPKENCTGHRARPSVSYGGSSASGARPSTTTSTDQDTGTSNVTRETRPELAQDMARPSSSDDTGGDVTMEGEMYLKVAQDTRTQSGPDNRRRITTKREPREARDEQSSATEQHVPRTTLPEELVTPLGGCAREVAAWLGYVDPKHEAGRLMQQITNGALRATEGVD